MKSSDITREAVAVVAWCRARRSEMVELLRALVDTPSHAAQREGVAQVAAIVRGQLEPLGFAFEEHRSSAVAAELAWVEQILSPEVPYDELASSYVGRRASGPRRLLLLGDLDTALPGVSPGARMSTQGGRAYGAGVADMKGGLVVMMMALRALEAVGATTPSISIVLAGDEQAGSLSSRTLIESEARTADWCLCLECARDGGKLLRSRAHIGVGLLEALGREAHAGSSHSAGANAIDAIARVIPALNELTRPQSRVFVTVTLISGGRRRSVVPAKASAVLDVRTSDWRAWETTRRRIEKSVRGVNVAGVTLTIRLHAHRPGFSASASRPLLAIARRAGQDLGLDIAAQDSAAAGSSAFVGALGVPTLDGMGPSGGSLMTSGEYVDLDSLTERAALLALTIRSLLSGGPPYNGRRRTA